MNVDMGAINIDKLAKTVRMQLNKAVGRLQVLNHPIQSHDVAKLKSDSSGTIYVVRLGRNHRAVFTIRDEVIIILAVRHRKDMY